MRAEWDCYWRSSKRALNVSSPWHSELHPQRVKARCSAATTARSVEMYRVMPGFKKLGGHSAFKKKANDTLPHRDNLVQAKDGFWTIKTYRAKLIGLGKLGIV
jgi:hypothetical protein